MTSESSVLGEWAPWARVVETVAEAEVHLGSLHSCLLLDVFKLQ